MDINLLWAIGLAAGQALGVTLHNQADVQLPPLHQVAAIEMSSAPYVAVD